MEGRVYLNKVNIPEVNLLTEDVFVPRWNCYVIVSELTGFELDSYQQSLFDIRGSEIVNKRENHQAKLLRWALKDENGQYVFENVIDITKMPSQILNELFTVASRLNGMSKEENEVLEKN